MQLKNTIVLEDLLERECLFHESERRAATTLRGYFENVNTQVDIENSGGPIMRTRQDTRP